MIDSTTSGRVEATDLRLGECVGLGVILVGVRVGECVGTLVGLSLLQKEVEWSG